jgi:hypothetical protein
MDDGCVVTHAFLQVLDICDLKVKSVTRTETGEALDYEVVMPPQDTWRSFLKISGPSSSTQK